MRKKLDKVVPSLSVIAISDSLLHLATLGSHGGYMIALGMRGENMTSMIMCSLLSYFSFASLLMK